MKSEAYIQGWEVHLLKIGYINIRAQKKLDDDGYRMGEKSSNTHKIRTPKSVYISTAQRLSFPFNVPQRSRRGKDHQSLVCHDQDESTWRKTWKWGRIVRLSWMNCRMPTWIVAMTQVTLCGTRTPSAIYSSMILFTMTLPSIAVGMTEMRCSIQRRLPISSRSWNIILREWWYERVWGQLIWLELTFSMKWRLIRQCWRLGSDIGDTWMSCGCSTIDHKHTSLFLCTTFWMFSKPLEWRWFSEISGTINMTTM